MGEQEGGHPRLVEGRKLLAERIAKYDERILTVLKNHLATEQSLNDLLTLPGDGGGAPSLARST
jgi:hypothetical protein